MTIFGWLLLIILVMLVLGAAPAWPHSRGWGYGPSGVIGLILVIVLIMMLAGVMQAPWAPVAPVHHTVVVP